MKIQKEKLINLKIHPDNVRLHRVDQKKALFKSFEMFGQIRPIVIDENNLILAGNGFVESLIDYVPEVEKFEVDVYKVVNLSEKDKKKLMLADNQTYELGSMNHEKVLQFLEEIAAEEDFEIPGFEPEVVRSMFEITTEEIDKYGSMRPEEIIDMKDIADQKAVTKENILEERKKEREFVKPDEEESEYIEINNENIKTEMKNDEVKPYVKCPNCGEKVWL